jgi:hypothetical protein
MLRCLTKDSGKVASEHWPVAEVEVEMLKAGTTCIVLNSYHTKHAGHVCVTDSDTFVSSAICGCGCGEIRRKEPRNLVTCSCGATSTTCPTRWLRPLPPIFETEQVEQKAQHR